MVTILLKDDAVIPEKLTLQLVLTATTPDDEVLDKTVILIEIEQDEFKPYPKVFEKFVYLGSASDAGLEMNSFTLLPGVATDIQFSLQDCKYLLLSLIKKNSILSNHFEAYIRRRSNKLELWNYFLNLNGFEWIQ